METQRMPDIRGLEVFQIEVNGDDPRWSKIERKRYAYCNETARIEDFPVEPGKWIVCYVLLPCPQDNSNQGVIDNIAWRNLSRPDRAVTETILDARKAECVENPIVGVCGVVQSETHGYSVVGYVKEDEDGRNLYIHDLASGWHREGELFIAVVSRNLL